MLLGILFHKPQCKKHAHIMHSRPFVDGTSWPLAERKRLDLVREIHVALELQCIYNVHVSGWFPVYRYNKKSKVMGQKEILRAVRGTPFVQ